MICYILIRTQNLNPTQSVYYNSPALFVIESYNLSLNITIEAQAGDIVQVVRDTGGRIIGGELKLV